MYIGADLAPLVLAADREAFLDAGQLTWPARHPGEAGLGRSAA